MRKIFFLFLLAAVTRLPAQTNDYLVTMKGIGTLKIGMMKDDLEKLIGKKIALKNLLDKDGYADTIRAKYKSIDVQLYIEKQYKDNDKYDIVLSGVRTTSTLCKTANGLGIGSDKMKIIGLYDNNPIYAYPEYNENSSTPSKTRSVVNVSDYDTGNAIVFYLTNKKVVAIEITYSEGD